jgi:hypothetical protein
MIVLHALGEGGMMEWVWRRGKKEWNRKGEKKSWYY